MHTAAIPIIGVFIPIIAIVGGIAVAIIAIWASGKASELKSRERLAAIEHGILPEEVIRITGNDANGDGKHPLISLRNGLAWAGVGIGWFLGFFFFIEHELAFLGVIAAFAGLAFAIVYPSARKSYLRANPPIAGG